MMKHAVGGVSLTRITQHAQPVRQNLAGLRYPADRDVPQHSISFQPFTAASRRAWLLS